MQIYRLVAAALAFAGSIAATAMADVIPPPVEHTDIQKQLTGSWDEASCSYPVGLGHVCLQRSYTFGDTHYAIVNVGYLPPSGETFVNADVGTWTATQPDAKTLKITVSPVGGEPSELTVTLESNDAFVLTDSMLSERYEPSRFVRRGK